MSGVAEQSGSIGRGTTIVLILVTLICVGLIGASGYVKFQIDRNEYKLASLVNESTVSVTGEADTAQQNAAQQASKQRDRYQTEHELRNWSLVLTFISWASLILASALVISIYLILQRRQSPALRALSQSISNLARGDMQTPIWGIERHDAIGDLARSVDLARYHFSQLPDMSLLSDQGPVRIKFEGGARTLFEAMMQQISSQAARIGDEAAELAASAASHHKVVSELPIRLNGALDQLQRYGQANAQAMQKSTQGLSTASAQLEKLVPFMQNRAQNMAEVTQLAGTQVASTLKNLIETESSLRHSTDSSQKTVAELANATKEVSERIFAALNLMQASSKLFNETTESSQSHLKQLIDTMGQGEAKLGEVVNRVEQRLETTAKAENSLSALAERSEANAEKMDAVIQSMTERHEKLNEQFAHSSEQLNGIISSFDSAQQALSQALQNINRDGGLLTGVFNDLKTSNEQVLAKLSRTSETGHEVVQHLAECSQNLMQQLQDRLASSTTVMQEQIDAMTNQNKELVSQASNTAEKLTVTTDALASAQDKFEHAHAHFSDTMNQIGGTLEHQIASAFSKTDALVSQNQERLHDLTASVDQSLQRLSVLGQLTSTLGTVAGELGRLIPTLGNGERMGGNAPVIMPEIDVDAIARKLTQDFKEHWQTLSDQMRALVPSGPAAAPVIDIDVAELSGKLLSNFEERWRVSTEQIDSVRDDLAMLLEKQKDHLEMRMMVLDKQIKSITGAKETDPRQILLLQEIVSTLTAMNHHLAHTEAPDVSQAENEIAKQVANFLSDVTG